MAMNFFPGLLVVCKRRRAALQHHWFSDAYQLRSIEEFTRIRQLCDFVFVDYKCA